ncbi:MAG: winged helix-turn-helix transcriptional regulator [Planctomycetota bacterium]
MTTLPNDHIRPVDQVVLETLKRFGGGVLPQSQEAEEEKKSAIGLTVQELTEHLGVTPTAIRQRLERLTEMELIARSKESVGRGRPVFRYCLTQLGSRFTSASYADLANALWQELMGLPNPQQRNRVLRRVAKRMGDGLKESIQAETNLQGRLAATAVELSRRNVEASVGGTAALPLLEVHCCPYPEITQQDDGRQLCEMEQEMLSDALGQSVQLDCCRLDGHDHCQFRPITDNPDSHAAASPSDQSADGQD